MGELDLRLTLKVDGDCYSRHVSRPASVVTFDDLICVDEGWTNLGAPLTTPVSLYCKAVSC